MMLLAKAVEKAKEITYHRCECGVQLTRYEYQEYGKCMNCVLEAREDD